MSGWNTYRRMIAYRGSDTKIMSGLLDNKKLILKDAIGKA